ncbi:GPALPP motifs-containing protein 1-like [Symsagittifera roscoffensis]|uniref:GPALPP motifs-containing protein 1-like n=1 Tax=Symsagittifera roscoffensis TaxID=84072 RepID=UPI00307C953E
MSKNGVVIGPTLPPHLRHNIPEQLETDNDDPNPKAKQSYNDHIKSDSESDDEFGPALPPPLSESGASKLEERSEAQIAAEPQEADGPTIGPIFSDLVSGEPTAKRPKMVRKDVSEKKVQREEWMTLVPEVLTKNFGSGPRKFDTSSRSKIPIDADEAERGSRDFEQERIARELSDKRKASSLLDEHRKIENEKAEKQKDEKLERVPFNRERDMKTRLLDSDAKNKLIKNCQAFSSKFSSSKTSKYL